MNNNEKAYVRSRFKLRIHESDGQAFEDLFVRIMNYYCPDFQSVKPWGNIGDRKNDGFIRKHGIYFQVYGPENIKKSYKDVINKLKDDLKGLLEQWKNVRRYYFVVNDKYKGINADSIQIMETLKEEYKLEEAEFLMAKDLEDIFFKLENDMIYEITGYPPDFSKIKNIDYSILNEVIEHIMKQSKREYNNDSSMTLPDWEDKIVFNNLSVGTRVYLNSGYIQIGSLEEYLSKNSDFLAEELKKETRNIYLEEMETFTGDELFWKIVERISPKGKPYYEEYAIIIMSKYFESCDIFEDPEGKES